MEENKKRAILLGATGLIGNELLKILLVDYNYDEIVVLVRKSTGIKHQKLTEYIIDFDKPTEWESRVKGDVLFSAFGTTIKKAGSKENQYKIDVTYQVRVAEAAVKNGVAAILLVSSSGANAGSKFFYNRIKGELDDAVKALSFVKTTIFKPSVLVGKRPEKRYKEAVAIFIMQLFTLLPFIRKFRPIKGATVARAMIYVSKLADAEKEYRLSEIQALIKKSRP